MKKHYITSLKGIACLLVAMGHFLGTIKYASYISLSTEWFAFLQTYRLDFLVNESFWLYLFFVVSGYLVANSAINKPTDIVVRSIIRFLRLGVPIFAACFLILLLSKTVSFYNDATKVLFENDWLQSSYSSDLTFLEMLLSPFYVLLFGIATFNSPYWVLSSMLFASFIIYIITYVNSKVKSRVAQTIFIAFLAIALFFLEKIIFSCLIGAIICYYNDVLNAIFRKKLVLILIGLVAFALCFVSNLYGAILFFSWLIIAIPRFTKLQAVLEIKPLRFLGEISFGIYSFHWPIFCSVGSLLIIKLWENIGGGFSLLISIIVSMAITILISIIFFHIVEKPSGKFVGWTKNKLQSLFSFNKKRTM